VATIAFKRRFIRAFYCMHNLAHSQNGSSEQLVLVVDDEASIRRSLEGVLKDEGFSVLLAEDGESAIRILMNTRPALVLLDIWMPGMDGLETLRKIKELHPELPVVMISGHATISTAVAATRLGASDFIEKPLDLSGTIQVIRRVVSNNDMTEAVEGPRWEAIEPTAVGPLRESVTINPIVFSRQSLRGRAMPQKTLAHAAILYGQGLHSGRKSGLILEPLPPNSGIHFVGVSETTVVPAHVDFVESTGYATTVRLGQTQAGTIEHLMSALCAYGISNVLVKCNGEVPVMDGSAREFCRLFEEVGLTEQDGEWYEIDVRKNLEVGDDKEWIRVEPADEFTIEYTLRYPEPVGEQQFSFTLTDGASYRDQIAPSRTFSFVKDVGHLQRQGLALGGRFDNFLLIGAEGAINDAWRFPNEPVRHKVLDAIGDLYLLGRRLKGKVTAMMTGHSDNIALLKKVREELQRER
jgi:UDP-3-O-[3-hydroxymyristoyl] N-acetylglucosamine deacetylase